MRQINLVGIKDMRLENVEKPSPRQDEVLIKVKQVGICGSDVHAYYGKHPFISFPIVPGHEFVGIVEKVGDGSEKLRGQRVTVLPSLVCGHCFNCRTGHFNICENLRVLGCQAPGAFADYVLAPKEMVFSLPDEISWDQGVLVEPLAVAVHAVRMIPNIAGENTLVLGTGTIGLMVVAVLQAYGAGNIIVSDFNRKRLDMAKRLGADHTINPGEVNLGEWLNQHCRRIDSSFECVGIEQTANQGILFTRKGGHVIIVGVFEEGATINLGLVQDKEIKMLGTLMYNKEDYKEALRLIRREPAFTDLITHRFDLDKASDAFEVIEKEARDVIKVVLDVNEKMI